MKTPPTMKTETSKSQGMRITRLNSNAPINKIYLEITGMKENSKQIKLESININPGG